MLVQKITGALAWALSRNVLVKSSILAGFMALPGLTSYSVAIAAEAPRFGVVDMQRVILSVDEGKKARQTLEAEIKGKETELLNQKKELDQMNEDWKKQAALLSEQARMDKQKEFQEKFLKLRQAEMDFQEEIKRKEQQETQKIAFKVAEMVDSLAKGEKLEAVFETNTAGLLYLANPVDLTDKVIKMYDDKKPAAKP